MLFPKWEQNTSEMLPTGLNAQEGTGIEFVQCSAQHVRTSGLWNVHLLHFCLFKFIVKQSEVMPVWENNCLLPSEVERL